MIKYPYVAYGGYLLFFFSYSLYFLGLFYPLFKLEGDFPGSEYIISNLEYNFLDAIRELKLNHKYFPIGIIAFFTFIVPISKFLLGVLCLFQQCMMCHINQKRYSRYLEINSLNNRDEYESIEKLYKFINTRSGVKEHFAYWFTIILDPITIIRSISKYQLTDSFMAMIMLALLMESYVSIVIMQGGFFFWGYCLTSLMATQMISVSQESTNKNMLFQPEILEFTTISDYNNQLDSSLDAKKYKLLDMFPSIKLQIKLAYLYITILLIILISSYAFYSISYTMYVSVYLVNEKFNLFSSTLKGYQIIERLTKTKYIVNGFLTCALFIFLLPLIHIILSLFIYIYLGISFSKDEAYKRHQRNLFLDSTSNSELDSVFNFFTIYPVNFIKGYTSPILNEYDLLTFKYSSRRGILKLLSFVNHLGDWCMIDVYCIASLSAFFTLNGMPNIYAHSPYYGEISNFYYVVLLGVAAFLYNSNFYTFSTRILSLQLKSFDFYNRRFNLLPQLLAQDPCEGVDPNNNSRENSTHIISRVTLVTDGSSTSQLHKMSEDFDNKVERKKRNVKLKVTSSFPYFLNTIGFTAFLLASLILSIVLTYFYSTPITHLSINDLSDLLKQSKKILNSYISQAPMSIGNCNPYLNTPNDERYRANAFYDQSTEVDLQYRHLECYPFTTSSSGFDKRCIFANPDNTTEINCPINPPSLLDTNFNINKVLGNAHIIIYELYGLSTTSLKQLELTTTNDGKIKFEIELTLPDFDYHMYYELSTLRTHENSTDFCCQGLQKLYIDATMNCNSDDPQKSLFDNLVFESFKFEELHIASKNNPLLFKINICKAAEPIFLNFLNSFASTKFLIMGKMMNLSDFLSLIITQNSRIPFQCPVKKVDLNPFSDECLEDLDLSLPDSSYLKLFSTD